MRTRIRPAVPAAVEGALASRAAAGSHTRYLWQVQSAGLVVLLTMSFFPAWSHWQEYCFLTLLTAALGTAYLEGRMLWGPSLLHLPVLLWLGWVLATVPFATDPAYSFSEWRKLLVKIAWFYWTLAVLSVATTDRMDGKIMTAVLAGTVGLCSYAIVDFVQRGGTWTDRLVRARAPGSDYNWLATYLVMALPLLAAGSVHARRIGVKGLYASAAVLAFVTQGLSYTRAAWLALAAQGVAFGLVTKRYRLLLGMAASFLAGTALLWGLGARGYHKDTLDTWTWEARLAVWSLMADEIRDHPLVGVGYGNDTFTERLGHHPEAVKAPGSHSFLLMVAMGSGLPALALLVWVLAAAVTECLFLAQAADEPATKALLLALALMVVGFAVRNGFDSMFSGSLACLFWMLLAVGVAHGGNPKFPVVGPLRSRLTARLH